MNLRNKYLQIAQKIKNVLETTKRWPFFDRFFSFHPLYYKTPFFLCSVWHDTHYEAGGWHQDNLHSLWQPLLQQTSWRVSKTLNIMFTLTLNFYCRLCTLVCDVPPAGDSPMWGAECGARSVLFRDLYWVISLLCLENGDPLSSDFGLEKRYINQGRTSVVGKNKEHFKS